MTKRVAKQRVSYAEPSSDSDDPSSDDELMRTSEDDAGTSAGGGSVEDNGKGKGRAESPATAAPPPAKKKRFGLKEAYRLLANTVEKAGPTLDADLLLSLPFDALVEICRHLDFADLLSLSRTSHKFRRLLLGSSGRQLWTAVRVRDGYYIPQGISEIKFAVLLVGTDCQVCANSQRASTLWGLGVRICTSCSNARLVSRASAPKKVSGFNKQALLCTRYSAGTTAGRDLFVMSELAEKSLRLRELEEEEVLGVSSTKTRSRRRSGAAQVDVQPVNAADEYFKAEQDRAKQNTEETERIQHGLKLALERAKQRAAQVAEARKLAKQTDKKAHEDELKREHGWTDAHFDFLQGEYSEWWTGVLMSRPDKPVPEDPEGWRAYREKIEHEIEKAEYEVRVGPARDARLERLKGYYPAVKDEIEDELEGVLPGFEEFKDLDAIKPLWEPEDAQLDATSWPTQLPLVKEALKEFAESIRVHAVRVILAAQTGKSLKSVSSNPAKYPADTYDAAFFSRITSHFICYNASQNLTLAVSYPNVVKYARGLQKVARQLEVHISYKAVVAVRTVVKAAGLDEDTVTPDDLRKLGDAFSLADSDDKRSFDWLHMVDILVSDGPTIKDLKAGKRGDIKLTPPAEHAASSNFV